MFAKGTKVSIEKSQAEIQKMVTRYGATHYVSGITPQAAVIMFEAHNRRVKFILPLPKLDDVKRWKNAKLKEEAFRSEQRRLWRAFALVIKAKLEAVESKVSSFESEFLAQIVDPGSGRTIGEVAIPALVNAYERGQKMPPLLGVGT